MNKPKILLLTPIPYGSGGGFWERDSALLIPQLIARGYDARLVALGPSTGVIDPQLPLILASLEELERGDWWKGQAPGSVFFLGWSLKRFDNIRRAIRGATPRLVERLDTDGNRISRLDPNYSAFALSSYYKHKLPRWAKLFATPLGIGKTFARCRVDALGDAAAIESMALAGCVAAESPLAVARTERACRLFPYPQPKVVLLEHPIDASLMGLPGTHIKENLFSAVGRWDDPKKNPELLIDLSNALLEVHPTWKIRVVGRSTPEFRSKAAEVATRYGTRFIHEESLLRPQIAELFASSKICLTTSVAESFSNTMSEALCCGASVVGWQQMAAMHYLTSLGFGTMSTSLTTGAFVDAVCLEMEAWASGARDPICISRTWQRRVGNNDVADRLINALESL